MPSAEQEWGEKRKRSAGEEEVEPFEKSEINLDLKIKLKVLCFARETSKQMCNQKYKTKYLKLMTLD